MPDEVRGDTIREAQSDGDVAPIDLALEPAFFLGELWIEPGPTVVVDGQGARHKLEPKVMLVLLELVRAQGAILSRAALRRQCWGGRIVSDDAIDRVIARVRRLGEETADGSFVLETIPKVGYRLKAVEPVAAAAAAAPARLGGNSRRTLIVGGVLGVGGLGVGGFAAWRWLDGAQPSSVAAPSLTLVVMPFKALADSAAMEAPAEQLSDMLRADFARMHGLQVIAGVSSAVAASGGGSVQEIGRALGAGLLIDGTARVLPNGVEFKTSLVEAGSNRLLWSLITAQPVLDLDEARSRISSAVIPRIAGLIPGGTSATAPPTARPDPLAYALVVEAQRLLERVRTTQMRGQADTALAMGDLADDKARQALAIDPDYVEALLVLAQLARNGWTRSLADQPLTTEQRVEQSISLVRQALQIDPNNASALTLLGDYYRRFAFRWSEAENLFSRAIASNPNLVEAHWSYAYMLGTTGEVLTGLDHALTVFELDPRNPFRRIALPRLLYLAGDRASAMKRYQIELTQQPDNLFLIHELYLVFLTEGNARDLSALASRVRREALSRGQVEMMAPMVQRMEAAVEALQGRPERFRNMIAAGVARFDVDGREATPLGRARDDLPYIFAVEYAWAGQADAAMDMLERALVGKSLYWPATLPFGNARLPEAVRRHPRYVGLWRADPGLVELLDRRRSAITRRQMAGYAENGRSVTPAIGGASSRRLARILAQAPAQPRIR